MDTTIAMLGMWYVPSRGTPRQDKDGGRNGA